MIRLWLSRAMDISIQQQLRAQIVLGILSRRISPGERLPSVRALARQLHLHPNTVSAVYQILADEGWVARRRGSGMYVRRLDPTAHNENGVDLFAKKCLDEGLARGFSVDQLRNSFATLTHRFQTESLLVVNPDNQLARILATEIGEGIGREVSSADSACGGTAVTPETCLLVTQASLPRVIDELGPGVDHKTIRLKSMQEFLAGYQRPNSPSLIAVASHSDSVLRWASMLLSALGFPGDSVLLRNATQAGWQDGLRACDIVAVDVVTASELPATIIPVIFRIVADDFLAEMRAVLQA
ncbi:MAG: GntR family transcriptional regulator [Acidobacteriaceae bacterium]|nr:GntR family transcriptional regulator [Acidobacteriaceae bacterium]